MIEATVLRGDTGARIVDVATRLLREQGPAAVTTRGVAEGAGVQAPTIYRLFGDKDGLLDAVAEHVMATYVSEKAAVSAAAAAHDVDPVDDLRAGWRSYIDFGLAHPTLHALLSDPERALRSPATRSGQQVLEDRVHRIALTGRLRVSERRAVELVHAAGAGTVLTLLSTPPNDRAAGLAEEMLDAVLRQIVMDPPGNPDGDVGPSAVAGRASAVAGRASAVAGRASAVAVRASAVALRAAAPTLEVLSEAERSVLAEWLDRTIEAS